VISGGCKISVFAEFCGAAAVITESGRVQRQFHVTGERNPSRVVPDVGGDQLAQRARCRQRIGGRLWQVELHVRYCSEIGMRPVQKLDARHHPQALTR
jgi:hypothetical protein